MIAKTAANFRVTNAIQYFNQKYPDYKLKKGMTMI